MSSKRKRPALAGEGNWEQLAEDLYGVDFQKNQLGEVVDLAAADLIDEDLMKEVLAEVAPEGAEPPSTPDEDAGVENPVDAAVAPAADENIQIVWDEDAVTEKPVVEESIVEQVVEPDVEQVVEQNVEQNVETAAVEPVVVDEDAGQSEIVASETADEVSIVFDSEDDNSVAVTEFAAIEPDQAAEVEFADVTEETASVDLEEPDLSGDELDGSDDEIEDELADEKSASSNDGYWEALEDFDWGDSRTKDKPTSDVKPKETKPRPSSSVKAPIETRESPIVSKDEFIDDDSFGAGVLEADFSSDKDFDFGDSETLAAPVEDAPSMETEAAVESVTSTSESSTSESSSTDESTEQPRKRRRRRRRRRKPTTAETDQEESQDSAPVEDDVQPAEDVAEPVEEQPATLNDSTETESDSDDGTEKKVRRRSRSRRRRRKPSEASKSTESEELDEDSDSVDPVDDIDDNPDKETDSKPNETSFQDLPTWEEAIVYLLDPSLVGKNQESDTSGSSAKGDASKGSKSSGRRGRRRR